MSDDKYNNILVGLTRNDVTTSNLVNVINSMITKSEKEHTEVLNKLDTKVSLKAFWAVMAVIITAGSFFFSSHVEITAALAAITEKHSNEQNYGK